MGLGLRVSCKLYDGSGSIKMILTKDIASKVLQRNLAELVLLASSKIVKPLTSNNSNIQLPPSSEIILKPPDTIEVIEAVTDKASSSSSYREEQQGYHSRWKKSSLFSTRRRRRTQVLRLCKKTFEHF